MAQQLTVVVTGSTGKQGGAVARGLLERGHKVRAVTREPNSSQAKLLANAGASLVAASLEDTAAIMKALEGATSFFAMTTPFGGTEAEIRQGVAAADAAKAAGVHLVFTSVGSANRHTGIPHFDSKYEVEKHIAKTGVRATILAPGLLFRLDNQAQEQVVDISRSLTAFPHIGRLEPHPPLFERYRDASPSSMSVPPTVAPFVVGFVCGERFPDVVVNRDGIRDFESIAIAVDVIR